MTHGERIARLLGLLLRRPRGAPLPVPLVELRAELGLPESQVGRTALDRDLRLLAQAGWVLVRVGAGGRRGQEVHALLPGEPLIA